MSRPSTSSAAVLAAILLAVAGAGTSARADDGAPAALYSVALRALTGPAGADLTVTVDAAPAAPAVDMLKKVQVKVFAADGSVESVRNLQDVPAPGGRAELHLGQVERARRVEADVHVQDERPYVRGGERTYILRGATTTRLRPDLVVGGVHAPVQTTTSRSIDVTAEIEELNGDTGATATATLMLGPTPLARPRQVSLAAGATASVTFADVTVPVAQPSMLEVHVQDAAPGETDVTNNAASTRIDVSEHELVVSDVLVPSLGGYGVQFNQHVYAPITTLPAGSTFGDLETAAKAFEPQLVRIFYNENWEEDPSFRFYDPRNIESFRRTVALAQAAGATINVTYHTVADARLAPGPHMKRFADVLQDLRERGNTNVVWATVGNEPNTPGALLTLPQYEALYRALHAELVARGLRDEIKLMGGDLIESSGARDHELWFEYMTTNMTDVVDAYSEHIYWWYDTFNLEGAWRFEFRLRDIRKLVVDDNAPETRRPPYIMEFAVRGHNAVVGKPPVISHAYYEDGTYLRETNVAAFQQLWFGIASAQLGFVGAAKWDLYWGLYDTSSAGNQSYWLLDPTSEGWKPFPSYHALRLLLSTTERGWQVVRVAPWERDDWDPLVRDQPEKEIAAYVGGSELTVLGLDSRGRLLNARSDESPTYSVGGLPPSTTFDLVVWNAAGDGVTAPPRDVTTSAAGVARFSVPLHAAFALTTLDAS